jgi:leucyl/phenylalanyl-tRNA--protein transferase
VTTRPRPQAIDPDLLLSAYAAGIFPMADEETGEIGWYSPDPRGILPLDAFTVPRSLRQTIRKGLFRIRVNAAFEEVMRGCAARDETWISEEIIQSYVRLHELGYAHSVEAWDGKRLMGGLYGVAIGGAFFGESMFSAATGASKVCLVALVERLRERQFRLLDTQFVTPHLARFGAVEIPRGGYLALLRDALAVPARFID